MINGLTRYITLMIKILVYGVIINIQTTKSKEYRFLLIQHLSYIFTKCLRPKGLHSAQISMLRRPTEIFVMLYSIQLKLNRSISGY